MSRLWMWSAGVCLAALVAGAPASAGEKASKATCGSHGTTIDFLDTPQEAAKQAKKENKLVFVLHVSGIFDDPRFL
jgi:hypothetical protein